MEQEHPFRSGCEVAASKGLLVSSHFSREFRAISEEPEVGGVAAGTADAQL